VHGLLLKKFKCMAPYWKADHKLSSDTVKRCDVILPRCSSQVKQPAGKVRSDM
jgi:hypothetical protein